MEGSVHSGQSEVVMAPLVRMSDRPELRIGDADRERSAEIVSEAAAAGYLELAELPDRLEAVWSARTQRELDQVTVDIPARPQDRTARTRQSGPLAVTGDLSRYLAGMALMIGIWLAVALTAGSWYPWVIWPALGWGMAVLMRHHHRRVVHPERDAFGISRP